jgi:hypothetical protein
VFLIACRTARLAFLDDHRTLCVGLDNFSDDDDGADLSTPHEAPPVPSLLFTVFIYRTQRGSLMRAF